ncbi:hypothetical protein NBRC116590_31560 [Pelagimonas sp. KU-00592-HH]|uniref:glycosyltransferase family 2 protein n=1 Tax=Pelagimonas sp. KU-00592-HH TaxID=3127651 RepID=UPI00310C203B
MRPPETIGSPKVSVIVPIYNVADHIGPCIQSLQDQLFTDFEAILIDDGSTDGSGDIARSLVSEDPRFQIHQQANAGLSAARNAGLEHARGQYVSFIDSDDRVAPGFLERMVETLEQTEADWVSCAVSFCFPDGRTELHSATHGAPDIDMLQPRRQSLEDWNDVVRLYPSAWNKLYRRDLIEGLRFDEGLYFEDHPFYYRYAKRTDHIVLLPEPLYLHTRGREGQITREESERVFEQFRILELMREVMFDSDKANAQEAFSAIATRVTFERSLVLHDRQLRQRFINHSRALIGDGASDELGVGASWMSVLRGDIPVTVVVPTDGNPGPLRETLKSLAVQAMGEAEVLVVLDDGAEHMRLSVFECAAPFANASVLTGNGAPGVAPARNRGLDAARGDAIVFLDAGDTLPPAALGTWHNRLVKANARVGMAVMLMGGAPDAPHSGLHDPVVATETFLDEDGFEPTGDEGVYLHAHPSAKIFDRVFLQNRKIRFQIEPLASWYMIIEALAHADRAVYISKQRARIANRGETRRFWRRPETVDTLVWALERLSHAAVREPLTPQQKTRLFVRAVWEKINFADFPNPEDKQAFANAAKAHLETLDTSELSLDPYVGDHLKGILGFGEN